jgi:hypothetical protein
MDLFGLRACFGKPARRLVWEEKNEGDTSIELVPLAVGPDGLAKRAVYILLTSPADGQTNFVGRCLPVPA